MAIIPENTWLEAVDVLRRHYQELKKLGSYVGVGLLPDSDRLTNRVCFYVGVEVLPDPSSKEQPSSIEKYPILFFERGETWGNKQLPNWGAQAKHGPTNSCTEACQRFQDPILAGALTGAEGPNPDQPCSSCSFFGLVFDEVSMTPYGMFDWHCVTEIGAGVGSPAVQPCFLNDHPSYGKISNRYSEATDSVLLDLTPLAQNGRHFAVGLSNCIDSRINGMSDLRPGLEVNKVGWKTGFTYGKASSSDPFSGLFTVSPDPTWNKDFADRGDSGSAIVTEGTCFAVGLLLNHPSPTSKIVECASMTALVSLYKIALSRPDGLTHANTWPASANKVKWIDYFALTEDRRTICYSREEDGIRAAWIGLPLSPFPSDGMFRGGFSSTFFKDSQHHHTNLFARANDGFLYITGTRKKNLTEGWDTWTKAATSHSDPAACIVGRDSYVYCRVEKGIVRQWFKGRTFKDTEAIYGDSPPEAVQSSPAAVIVEGRPIVFVRSSMNDLWYWIPDGNHSAGHGTWGIVELGALDPNEKMASSPCAVLNPFPTTYGQVFVYFRGTDGYLRAISFDTAINDYQKHMLKAASLLSAPSVTTTAFGHDVVFQVQGSRQCCRLSFINGAWQDASEAMWLVMPNPVDNYI